MRTRPTPARDLLAALAVPAVLLGIVFLIGVVMADPHVPTAIEPDTPPAGNAAVATFALG